jgi:hypothetical protein
MRVEVIGVGAETADPGTGVLYYDVGSGWESSPMTEISANVYDAVFPASSCGSEVPYYVYAEAVGGRPYTDPQDAPFLTFTANSSPGQSAVYAFDFDSDPGWTTDSGWAFGQPTGGGGEYGGPDPTSGYTGVDVYGYNLNGDYENNMPERHLTSTAIDCTGLYDVHLKFWRWLGVEQPTYDHAYVRVSNNGTDWTTVWQNAATIEDSAWTQMDLDISAVADDQPTVYLRWTMGTSDGGWRYCGWNIDDVEIVATDCSTVTGVITGGWSCASHDTAGDFCIDLDAVNIEPRQPGAHWLEFDVTEPASSVNASVNCVNNTYTGAVTVTADGSTTVTVDLDPALPDEDCCEVVLTGDVQDSYQVRTLAGDTNLSGTVTSADALQMKVYFDQSADAGNFEFDFNCSGDISPADYLQIKVYFGNEAALCP